MTRPVEFLPLYRPTKRQSVLAVITFGMTLAWLFREALPVLSTHYIAGISADAGLYVWLSKNLLQQFSELPWFNTRAFYPYGLSLAWSDNFLLPSLFVNFLQGLGFSNVLAFNFMIFGCYLLSGLCTWELCYKLTNSQAASLLSALAFMAYGFLSFHLGHPQMQFAFFLPLGMSLFFETTAKLDPKLAFLMGLSVFFCFLCAVYYAVFLLLIYMLLASAVYFLRPGFASRRDFLRLAAALLLGMLPIVPFVLPYLEAKQAFGGRALYEAYYFSADVFSYLSASPLNWLYGFSAKLSHAEAHLFPGFVVLILALLAFTMAGGTKKLDLPFLCFIAVFTACLITSTQVRYSPLKYLCALTLWSSLFTFAFLARRIACLEQTLGFLGLSNRALLSALFFVALFFFAISLGPLGNPVKGQPTLGVFALLHWLVPGLDAMRAVSRAGIVVVLVLIVCAAFAIKRLLENYPGKKVAIWICLLFAILIENLSLHLPLESESLSPPVLVKLRDLAQEDEALIFLPLTQELDQNSRVKSWRDYAIKNVQAMNWSANLPLFLLNGYSGQRSKLMLEFPGRLQAFPDNKSLKTLEQIVGLRFIVVDTKALGLPLSTLPDSLKLIAQDERGYALLEFSPLTLLDANFTLLAPPFARATVKLELLNAGKKDQGNIPIDVLLDGKPFFAIDLPKGSLWESHLLTLPAFQDQLRPARLSFKLPASAQVFLRKRSISLDN